MILSGYVQLAMDHHALHSVTGMVSLVGTTQEGHAIEVGTIGNEGVAGGFIALGSDRSASAGMVQCSGDFLRIMVEDLRAELGPQPRAQ
jgi:hypothetical protein